MTDPTFLCLDCGKLSEWYMLENEVWLAAVPEYSVLKVTHSRVFFCLSCVEARLGRALLRVDFTSHRANELLRWGYSMAQREQYEASMRESGPINTGVLFTKALIR